MTLEPALPTAGDGPQVFVDDLAVLELDPADRHHLERVLRLRAGDPLTVSDGRGAWQPCRFVDGRPEPTGDIRRVPAPEPPISVAFALVKGHKPELVVQKLTELGVDVIRPFVASRSVVRWAPAKQAAGVDRLNRIGREAAMQCRRVRLPVVTPVADFADVASRPGAGRAEPGAPPLSLATPTVLVGPEGGWAPEERDVDLPVVGLGDHILRSETAAIAAGVLLAGLRSGLVRSARTGD